MSFKSVNPQLAANTDRRKVTREMRQHVASQERRIAAAQAEPKKEEGPSLADPDIRAKWKIELTFGKNRTSQGPNAVGIQVWESGKHFHGGGDALAFFCKDNRDGQDSGCWGVIPQDNINKAGIAYCPNCQLAINAELLTNMKRGLVTTQALVDEVERLFRQLGSNADIYVKYHKLDARYIAMERAKGPHVAARLKGMHIYPLKNILKDTASGASLAGRFKAFLTS